jgi:glycosyltransferase involved in cell wall biosynthesis
MKNILFYYPSNKRTVALETLLIALKKNGHKIIILTTCKRGDFHEYMESVGFKTYTHEVGSTGPLYYLKQFFFLLRFSRIHAIDMIHSHLQHTNFIAVLASKFLKARVIIFRHHFRFVNHAEEQPDVNKNELFFDRVINRLASVIVVPSSGVYNGIKEFEKANMNKVHIIPYLYDFSQYAVPDISEVEKIKSDYPCKLRLIMVSRLIRLKQHHVVFPVIKELVEEGIDIKLLVLDEGPEKGNLEKYISQHKLTDKIIMPGFRTDFINYMAASDLLIQPSLTDASNSAAKEMGFLGKPVAVSAGVGDYEDYIRHNDNGYLVPLTESAAGLKKIIMDAYTQPDKLLSMGERLKKDVLLKFDISNAEGIIAKYEQLMD